VRKLESFVKGRTQAEGLREESAEGDIWNKREKVTENWRKLHIKGLNDLPSSPITIQVIKSK